MCVCVCGGGGGGHRGLQLTKSQSLNARLLCCYVPGADPRINGGYTLSACQPLYKVLCDYQSMLMLVVPW